MNYQVITSSSQLESVCRAARLCERVALDTEFVRVRSFHPHLGLIQLYDGTNLSLIDPLEIEDMTPFIELLADQSVLKILHACSEDMEVFLQQFGQLPTPYVDTQILAAFIGHGISAGFAAMVKHYLSVELDKSESRTDWMARPLSSKQLDYAAADVYYLIPLYDLILSDVDKSGWLDAALEECTLKLDKYNKQPNPDLAYLDVKGAWQLDEQQLAILKPLATWRYQEAVKRDLALNFVFRDGDLLTVAKYSLKTKKAMDKHDIDERSAQRHAHKIGPIVHQAQQTSEFDCPEKIIRLMDRPGYKALFKLLKDEVKKVSKQTGLAPELLASKKQLNQVFTWFWVKEQSGKKPDALQGWRKKLFGSQLTKAFDKS